MDMVNVKINGIPVTVPEGLHDSGGRPVCRLQHPTLCFLKDINEIGACRICVVEVKGAKSLVPPASTPWPRDGGLHQHGAGYASPASSPWS